MAMQTNAATKQLPLFLGHGSQDPLIPSSLATRTHEGLKAAGTFFLTACQWSCTLFHTNRFRFGTNFPG